MKQHIVIINGSGGVGKDCFVEFCKENIEIVNISSVDKVKQAASILGWDGSKTEMGRLFLSDLKLLSTNYNNDPYEYIKDAITNFKKDPNYLKIMFIHIREPEEIDKIKNDFACSTLLIRNVNITKILSNMADANVDNYEYDYIINNDDNLDSLKKQANTFIYQLFGCSSR